MLTPSPPGSLRSQASNDDLRSHRENRTRRREAAREKAGNDRRVNARNRQELRRRCLRNRPYNNLHPSIHHPPKILHPSKKNLRHNHNLHLPPPHRYNPLLRPLQLPLKRDLRNDPPRPPHRQHRNNENPRRRRPRPSFNDRHLQLNPPQRYPLIYLRRRSCYMSSDYVDW